MKYALYMILVEDTTDNDISIGSLSAEAIERAAGNMDEDEAMRALDNAVDEARIYDHGIAR